MTGDDVFFFSSRRRHTRCSRDWSSDVCSSDLKVAQNIGKDVQVRTFAFGDRVRPARIHAHIELLAQRNQPVDQQFKPLEMHVVISRDRKSTRLNSSHGYISYAVFCLKKKN